MNRRRFLHDGSLLLLGAGVAGSSIASLAADESQRRVRIGLVTDLHFADKQPAGTRHYRESLTKFKEAAGEFQKAKLDFLVELGDIIDAADSVQAEKKYLATINSEFAALPGDKHYVLGNHCVATLSKEEFLEGVGQSKSHYSFDVGGFHFVILDACYRADGESYSRGNFKWTDTSIPDAQVDWLKSDLKVATGKAVVFVHQRLDVKNDYGVKNADQVRQVLEESGKVLAVIQGHSHKNDLNDIGGIHYCTLVAMVEGSGADNNGFSLMDMYASGTIRLTGFRKQSSYEMKMPTLR